MRYLLSVFVFILVSKEYVNAQKTADYHPITVEARRRVSNSDGTVIYRPYEPFKTRSIELLTGYTIMTEPGSLSKYGGDLRHRTKATGFFRVEKIGDRWWGVDPEGYLYINVALNSITRGNSERNEKSLIEKYGSSEKWITQTLSMLMEYGFNCAGSWSDYKAIIKANKTSDKPFAYTINWNFMSSYGRERGGTYQQPGHTGYPNDAIFVFDPEFEVFCDSHAKQLLETKDDPNLFGHFSDNEMPFKLKALDNYLGLPETDPGHKAAVKWMEEQGISSGNIDNKHRELFMAFVAEKYLSIISAAIRKYDPNHMYIGARFYSSEKNYPEFMKSAGKYLDIVSNNYYGKWTPDSTDMANWAKWTRRPFIITEYYTKGEDSGMPNQSGAGWIVKTQRDRGLFYQNYNLALLESKNCVGWHYFKYQDNDPTAKGADPSNADANKGIVDNNYNIWKPMMELMKELNNNVYKLIEYFDK
jgi:hypothetical protein